MSSMVERVSRAIEDEGPVGCCVIEPEQALKIARAAIKAMREPTDAMVDSAVDAIDQIPTWANLEIVAASHAAMIDAALNEQVSG